MKRFAAMFLALLLTVTTVSAAEWPSWAESARTWAEANSVSEGILAQPDARTALREQLRRDAHPLLALPYRVGVAFHLPGLLAGYTLLKNRFL